MEIIETIKAKKDMPSRQQFSRLISSKRIYSWLTIPSFRQSELKVISTKAQKKYCNNFAKPRPPDPHVKGILIRSTIWCISVV